LRFQETVERKIANFYTDPEGDFVEAIGRNFTVEQASRIINDHVSDWRGKLDKP
jgi:protein SCO1/2